MHTSDALLDVQAMAGVAREPLEQVHGRGGVLQVTAGVEAFAVGERRTLRSQLLQRFPGSPPADASSGGIDQGVKSVAINSRAVCRHRVMGGKSLVPPVVLQYQPGSGSSSLRAFDIHSAAWGGRCDHPLAPAVEWVGHSAPKRTAGPLAACEAHTVGLARTVAVVQAGSSKLVLGGSSNIRLQQVGNCMADRMKQQSSSSNTMTLSCPC